MNSFRTLCALLLACGPAAGTAQPQQTQIVFTLPYEATTSAGVYDTQGILLRTLWSGDVLPAGTHAREWDARDDLGREVAAREVEIRIVHHRMRYVWEGVYGNSSAAVGGAGVHKAFLEPTSFALDGSRILYSVGYNEHQPGLHAFPAQAPEQHGLPMPRVIDPFTSFAMIALDGNRLYWANGGGISHTSFVGVYDLAGAAQARFTQGVPVCLNRRPGGECYESQDYASVVSVETNPLHAPVGLAVQRNGRVLAVAHGVLDVVRLYDKESGAPLGQIALPLQAGRINQIAMTPGGDLWVISDNTVRRYTGLGTQPTLAATIAGLQAPVAVATSPTSEDEVWVADGAASQQLKRHDREGRLKSVLGRAGGYAHDPAVTSDRLCFAGPEGVEQTGMLVTPDAHIWVVDTCNNRTLRWRTDTDGIVTQDAQIAYLPGFYASTVDHGNPRRVFANFLEFDTDVDEPIRPGKSWRLVRNWLAGLPSSLKDDHAINRTFGGFHSVETLSNGRTYGVLRVHDSKQVVIVELPATGPLRIVRSFPPTSAAQSAMVMYENGDLGYSTTVNGTQAVLRLALTGFGPSGDPEWATRPVQLASVPALPGAPYNRGTPFGMAPRFPVTGSGKVVFFDSRVEGNEGFHLGAAMQGSSSWLWQASRTGPMDGKGSFQTWAVDGSVNYGGNTVWAEGRHILYGYHGEFFRDLATGRVGQANQFMHFDESGLFLGQFGQPSTRPGAPTQPGLSGNAFHPTLVRRGDRLYLYHNDESSHGGVHRWRIDGWNDVHDLRGRGVPGSRIILR